MVDHEAITWSRKLEAVEGEESFLQELPAAATDGLFKSGHVMKPEVVSQTARKMIHWRRLWALMDARDKFADSMV